jgi:uncharacterized repeat protein (TIGR03803 family)
MKRIVKKLSKLSWGTRACAGFTLCARAVALPAQTFTSLHSFDVTDGQNPYAGLVQGINGDGYGTTASGGPRLGSVFKITPSGSLTTLYGFCTANQDGCLDGQGPQGTLVQAANGDLYGTTLGAGANNYGTVFRITPSGTLTTIYSFCAQSECTDGETPNALQGGGGRQDSRDRSYRHDQRQL